MIRVSNIACPLDWDCDTRGGIDHTSGPLIGAIAHKLGVREVDICSAQVVKRSIDARKRSNVRFDVTAAVGFCEDTCERQLVQSGAFLVHEPYRSLDIVRTGSPKAEYLRPIVVGSGPAGMFAALYLARAGARPILLERGADVQHRAMAVRAFNRGGPLDLCSNIQFGEGGAGTFSDGKLTTGTKHPMAPHVLRWFVDAGAPGEILWDSKPHIGSDRLPGVVAALRASIIEAGGTVLFDTALVDFSLEAGHLVSIRTADSRTGAARDIPARTMVLACGHSARDTFRLLERRGVRMERKPFSIGVRIEHAQRAIDEARWGAAADHPALGAADYRLAMHAIGGRSAYTFCMCPGGQVVCAASEEGGTVTNGMSDYARDGSNANAALLVNVEPSDFGGSGPLAGIELQHRIERRAFDVAAAAGGAPYQAPAQTVGSFLGEPHSASDPVHPTYARGVVSCDLHDILPSFVCETIAAALPVFDAKLHGFADGNALMTAPETRSSSPVRICRDGSLQASVLSCGCGIYPCGEGAGYAGGIVSAAADGLRVAQQVALDAAGDAHVG
jgi:uncharacterized FAD-dependent dehydrogenase